MKKHIVLFIVMAALIFIIVLFAGKASEKQPITYTYIETKIFGIAGENTGMYLLRYLKKTENQVEIIELPAYSEIGVDNIYREMGR